MIGYPYLRLDSPTFTGLKIAGATVLGLNSAVFQSTTDGTSFFQVLDADGGTPILNIDVTNERVGIGTSTPGSTLHLVNGDFWIDSSQPQINFRASGANRWALSHVEGLSHLAAYSYSTGIGYCFFIEYATGNVGIKTADPQGTLSIGDITEGKTASLNIQTAHETHTLAAAGTSDTTTISIPAGATLLGVSFCVNTAVSDDDGNDTWSAAFITGSTATLGTAEAAAQNTKVDTLIVPEISSGVCQIRFTANGTNFDAGVIEIVAYYIDLTSLANV